MTPLEKYNLKILTKILDNTVVDDNEHWFFKDWKRTYRPRIRYGDSNWAISRLIMKLLDPCFEDHLQVNHKCDEEKCYNPKHLYLGTHQDNMDDIHRDIIWLDEI